MKTHLSDHDQNLLIGLKTKLESQHSGLTHKEPVTFQKAFGGTNRATKEPTTIGCTKDGYVCPDGTSVGRVPPDCNFAPCPPVKPVKPGGPFVTDYSVEDYSVEDYQPDAPGAGVGMADMLEPEEETIKPKPKKKNLMWILIILAIIALVAIATSGKKPVKR